MVSEKSQACNAWTACRALHAPANDVTQISSLQYCDIKKPSFLNHGTPRIYGIGCSKLTHLQRLLSLQIIIIIIKNEGILSDA